MTDETINTANGADTEAADKNADIKNQDAQTELCFSGWRPTFGHSLRCVDPLLQTTEYVLQEYTNLLQYSNADDTIERLIVIAGDNFGLRDAR